LWFEDMSLGGAVAGVSDCLVVVGWVGEVRMSMVVVCFSCGLSVPRELLCLCHCTSNIIDSYVDFKNRAILTLFSSETTALIAFLFTLQSTLADIVSHRKIIVQPQNQPIQHATLWCLLVPDSRPSL
jgi:hypothetical protein